jgi:hypothetical protein
VKTGVAVCKSCGAILNREKALALGLARDGGRVQPPPEALPQRHRSAEKNV